MICSIATVMGSRKIRRHLSARDLTLKTRIIREIDHLNSTVTSSGQRYQFRNSPVSVLSLLYHRQNRSPSYRSLHSKPCLNQKLQAKVLISLALSQATNHRSPSRTLALRDIWFRAHCGDLKPPVSHLQSSNMLSCLRRWDSLTP